MSLPSRLMKNHRDKITWNSDRPHTKFRKRLTPAP
jgi:hypothetical protein